MGNYESSKFIVDSLNSTIKKHTEQFRKNQKKILQNVVKNNDYKKFQEIITKAMTDSATTILEWEEKEFEKLGGLTPKQYIKGLSDIKDIIDLLKYIQESKYNIVPKALEDRIKEADKKFCDELLDVVKAIQLDDSKTLNSEQKSAIIIIEILGSEMFLGPLINIVKQFDEEKTDEDSFKCIMDAISSIGESSLDTLIKTIEDYDKSSKTYEFLLVTVARIASENKSERIYRYLKDNFRKSEDKVVEANALKIYGDGRAIPAIRGYVEKNIDNITPWEYQEFRDAVEELGGDMSDLDIYFDEYDEYDDEEYY